MLSGVPPSHAVLKFHERCGTSGPTYSATELETWYRMVRGIYPRPRQRAVHSIVYHYPLPQLRRLETRVLKKKVIRAGLDENYQTSWILSVWKKSLEIGRDINIINHKIRSVPGISNCMFHIFTDYNLSYSSLSRPSWELRIKHDEFQLNLTLPVIDLFMGNIPCELFLQDIIEAP
jgi:hypothetical protein